MELMKLMLADDVGVLSLITIVVTLAIVTVCIGIFVKRTREAARK